MSLVGVEVVLLAMMFGVVTGVGLGEVSEIAPPIAGTFGDCVGEGVEVCVWSAEDVGLGFGEVVVVLEGLGVGEISGLAIKDGKIDELGSRLGLAEADGDSDGEVVGEVDGIGDIVGEGVVLVIGEDVGNGEVVLVVLGARLGNGIIDSIGSNWA